MITFLEAYHRFGADTMAIAEALAVHESVAANLLARLKGETEPHPRAVNRSAAYNACTRAVLRGIRERHA